MSRDFQENVVSFRAKAVKSPVRFQFCLVAGWLVVFAPTTRGAANIFSDLGAGGTYTPYFSGGGRSVSGGTGQAPNSPAYSFVAGASLTLTQIDLALSYISGTNGAVVSLWTAAPWSVDVGPAFGTIAPGVQVGSWTVGPMPLATNNSANALTTISGIQGISLFAGTQYFLKVSPLAADTILVWNGNTTSSTSTLWQCGGYNSTFTVCTVGFISYANVPDGAFDLMGTAAQTQPPTPITITETGVVTSYSNPSLPKGSPSPVAIGEPFTLTTVFYPASLTPQSCASPCYTGPDTQGTTTLTLGGVSYVESNGGDSVTLGSQVANGGYGGIQISSGPGPGGVVTSAISSSTSPIPDPLAYVNEVIAFSSNVQGTLSTSNWASSASAILFDASLQGTIKTLSIQATRTTTLFTTTCGDSFCNLAPFAESATITFPYTVPLDGSTFYGPAKLTVNIEGSQATAIIPSFNSFVYGATSLPTGVTTDLQLTAAASIGLINVAGAPPTGLLLQPQPGLNSADFIFATFGEFHFFEVFGTYALGSGFEANTVVFVQGLPKLQVTTSTLPNATSHQSYSATLAATGGSGTGYSWSLVSGSLPNGFSLSPGGVLSSTGTPAAALQSYGFTVKVTDSLSNTTTQLLTLVVQPPPLPAVTILDPVPQLLNGPQIIGRGTNCANCSQLGSGGRQVNGIAADGIAQVVFRVPTLAAGDQVTATLFSDQCANPSTCSPSTSSNDNGGLFAIGGPVTATQSLPNTSTDTADSTTTDTFIAYRAPVDFVRANPSLATLDSPAPSRIVYVNFSYSSGGTTYGSQVVPLTIIRPPVVLAHGLWADSGDLADLSQLRTDQGFSVLAVNYGDIINVTQSTPPIITIVSLLSNIHPPTGSSLGFQYGARVLLSSIQGWLPLFKAGTNPIKQPVAAIGVDIVGHSMGALVARTLRLLPDYPQTVNYGQGVVHKIVSIGGPHLGSPLATALLDPANSCTRNFLEFFGFYAFDDCQSCVTANITQAGAYVGSGALGDLRGNGDGTATSPTIQSLQHSSITMPTAYITGVMTSTQINKLVGPIPTTSYCLPQSNTCVNVLRPINNIQRLITECGPESPFNDPITQNFTSPAALTAFLSSNNDGIVPLSSQLNGLSTYSVAPIQGVLHSPGTASLYNLDNQAGEPTELTAPVMNGVEQMLKSVMTLLNTPVSNYSMFVRE
jgi:pimeloyl-ACP methyl ester carboxylesterase